MSTAESPPVSRGLLITLIVVLALALLAAVYFFVVQPLLEDEPVAEPEPTEPVTDPGEPDVEELPEPDADADADEPVPETFEVFTARDPFQQLVTPDGVAPPPENDEVALDPDNGVAPDDDDEPAETQVGTTRIAVVDVFEEDGEQKVLVTVNQTGYEVAEGEEFADQFQVLDISGNCATLLYGDRKIPELCEGQSITK